MLKRCDLAVHHHRGHKEIQVYLYSGGSPFCATNETQFYYLACTLDRNEKRVINATSHPISLLEVCKICIIKQLHASWKYHKRDQAPGFHFNNSCSALYSWYNLRTKYSSIVSPSIGLPSNLDKFIKEIPPYFLLNSFPTCITTFDSSVTCSNCIGFLKIIAKHNKQELFSFLAPYESCRRKDDKSWTLCEHLDFQRVEVLTRNLPVVRTCNEDSA